jgi:voltage-gated sodium channel
MRFSLARPGGAPVTEIIQITGCSMSEADSTQGTLPLAEPGQRPRMAKLAAMVEGRRFQIFITVAILINAVTMGLETWDQAVQAFGGALHIADRALLTLFVAELSLRIFVHGWRFFRGGWNVFDFLIIGISVLPMTGNLSILRALRILRVLRLLSVVPQLRRVVEALLSSLPGMGAIVGVLMLVFYTGAVLATKLFGQNPAFAQWFGSIGASMYTLFQIMTLESWSMGIVRPVMEQYPYAWAFFVPFIFLTSFMVLNLFIAIIVNSMTMLHEKETAEIEGEIRQSSDLGHTERDVLLAELRALRAEVSELRGEVRTGEGSDQENRN